jgi:hypothetical protein
MKCCMHSMSSSTYLQEITAPYSIRVTVGWQLCYLFFAIKECESMNECELLGVCVVEQIRNHL